MRTSKLRSAVTAFLQSNVTHAQLNNVTLMELNNLRPMLPHALDQIVRIHDASKVTYSFEIIIKFFNNQIKLSH